MRRSTYLLALFLILNIALGIIYFILDNSNFQKRKQLTELEKEEAFHKHLESQEKEIAILQKYLSKNRKLSSKHYVDIPTRILNDLFLKEDLDIEQDLSKIIANNKERMEEISLLNQAVDEFPLIEFPADDSTELDGLEKNCLLRIYEINPDLPYRRLLVLRAINGIIKIKRVHYDYTENGVEILQIDTKEITELPLGEIPSLLDYDYQLYKGKLDILENSKKREGISYTIQAYINFDYGRFSRFTEHPLRIQFDWDEIKKGSLIYQSIQEFELSIEQHFNK